ncbi:MAG: tryptophanase [candidate division Zixibacteria bacterium]|nr:tryptophanase [candidate division Zixibacteria bacterium]
MNVKLSNGREIPVEMHKIRIVQKTQLVPVDERLKAIEEGGYNTFALRTRDIFIDMLTDSGTNAMSDNQLAAMMVSDDAYAGSESFYKLASAIKDVLGFKYVLPVHQGRAAEHLLAKVFIKPGDVIPMNYHFTTTKAHFELAGAKVLEIFRDLALTTQSTEPFKGNLDIQKFRDVIKKYGAKKIPFIRMEATTNLLGGQPFSIQNLKEVKQVASEHKIPLVYDGSLISENAYFVKQREKGYENKTIQEIINDMMSVVDIFYLSGRKSTCVRGGFIATNNKEYFELIKPWLPVYEGFLTYGGMSTHEIEAMAVGLREMTEIDVAGSAAEFVKYFAERLIENKIPVVTPPGGLACHVDAKLFLPHLPQSQYPAGALAAAIYITSGVRSMERGTISMDRDQDGNEVYSDLELARLAVPRRTYTMSHIEYVVDRIKWLHQHRDKVKGLKFVEEPPVLRFFFGKLEALDNWGAKLAEAFKKEFGPNY